MSARDDDIIAKVVADQDRYWEDQRKTAFPFAPQTTEPPGPPMPDEVGQRPVAATAALPDEPSK